MTNFKGKIKTHPLVADIHTSDVINLNKASLLAKHRIQDCLESTPNEFEFSNKNIVIK